MTGAAMHRVFVRVEYVLVIFVCVSSAIASSDTFTARVTHEQSGQWHVKFENHSNIPISAFALTVDTSTPVRASEYRLYYDALLNTREWVIAPGDSALVPLPAVNGRRLQGTRAAIHAVLFSDGSSSGDERWTRMLYLRRARTLARMKDLRSLIISESHPRKAEVIERLLNWKKWILGQNGNIKDELQVIDEAILMSALSTFSNDHGLRGEETDAEVVRNAYLASLGRRISILQDSKLIIDTTDATGNVAAAMIPSPRFSSQQTRGEMAVPSSSTDPTCFILSHSETQVVQLNTCGPSTTYDLSVILELYDPVTQKRTDTTYYDGRQDAYGSCWASYTDCTGISQPAGQDPGVARFHQALTSDGASTMFLWYLDDWSAPSTAPCSNCGTGVVFTAPVDTVNTSAIHYFKNSSTQCVVQ